MQRDTLQSIASEASRSTAGRIHDVAGIGVPVTVSGVTLMGVGMQDWVYILTAIVAAIQILRYLVGGVIWWRGRRLTQTAGLDPGAE